MESDTRPATILEDGYCRNEGADPMVLETSINMMNELEPNDPQSSMSKINITAEVVVYLRSCVKTIIKRKGENGLGWYKYAEACFDKGCRDDNGLPVQILNGTRTPLFNWYIDEGDNAACIEEQGGDGGLDEESNAVANFTDVVLSLLREIGKDLETEVEVLRRGVVEDVRNKMPGVELNDLLTMDIFADRKENSVLWKVHAKLFVTGARLFIQDLMLGGVHGQYLEKLAARIDELVKVFSVWKAARRLIYKVHAAL